MSYKQIQLRRGTAAEWAANNPILLPGEVGYERDTASDATDTTDTFTYGITNGGSGAIKIGDGVTRWADLPYLLTSVRFSLSSSSDVEMTSMKTGDVIRWSDGKWRNYPEATLLDGGNF